MMDFTEDENSSIIEYIDNLSNKMVDDSRDISSHVFIISSLNACIKRIKIETKNVSTVKAIDALISILQSIKAVEKNNE